jgi:hypothetical protein
VRGGEVRGGEIEEDDVAVIMLGEGREGRGARVREETGASGHVNGLNEWKAEYDHLKTNKFPSHNFLRRKKGRGKRRFEEREETREAGNAAHMRV